MASRKQLLIGGGGIAGMAAATAASRAGWSVRLYERAPRFVELGAGMQLTPNAVRCLQAWGFQAALRAVAVEPQRLNVRCAHTGTQLAMMPLGKDMVDRYGAPHFTIHRADLHRLLMEAACACSDVFVNPDQEVMEILSVQPSAVSIRTRGIHCVEGDALLLAGGIWGVMRGMIIGDYSRPKYSGYLAYRALLDARDVPPMWREPEVNLWLGERSHVVHYPVRRGEYVSVVAIVQGDDPHESMPTWDHSVNAQLLETTLAHTCTPLQDLIRSVAGSGGQWRMWPLCSRPPLTGPESMANGNVALIGDLAHPMLPYLSQGAAMALEDAAELQNVLAMDSIDVPTRLRRYALNRWQRNARVQAQSARNGEIYHASGLLRWGRNMGLRVLGRKLMDMSWLYGDHGTQPAAVRSAGE